MRAGFKRGLRKFKSLAAKDGGKLPRARRAMRRKITQKLRRINLDQILKFAIKFHTIYIFKHAARRSWPWLHRLNLAAALIFFGLRSLLQFCSFCKFLIFCRCCICPSCCCACCCIRLCCVAICCCCALCWACALSALNELNVSCDTACSCTARAASASLFCRFAQRFVRSLLSELAASHLLAYVAG